MYEIWVGKIMTPVFVGGIPTYGLCMVMWGFPEFSHYF